jgi:threonine dehydrogenase-like Zn-dependent dehydrogenase
MKLARLHGVGDVRLDEVERPEPGPRDAVLRIEACGICGSDVGYVKLGGMQGPGPDPLALGHEYSAVVDRVGREVTNIAPGARVVMNPNAAGNSIGCGDPGAGGFCPEVLARNVTEPGVLFEIPDEVPSDRAALAEPLGVGMQAVNQADVRPGQKVSVFGAGCIGMMAMVTLKYRGFEDVAIVDVSDTRLEIARKLGADIALNPARDDVWAKLREAHGTDLLLGSIECTGSDAYIECTGNQQVMSDILDQAKPKAHISVPALHREIFPMSLMTLMMKQLRLSGSMEYPENFGETVELLRAVDLSPLITHTFALDDFDAALEKASDPKVAGKVMIDFGGRRTQHA